MHSSRLLKFLTAILSVTLIAGAVLTPIAVMAADEEEPTIPDVLMVNAKYPSMTGPSDSTFKFEVEFTYRTGNPVGEDFDLTVTGPQGWHLRGRVHVQAGQPGVSHSP